MIPNDNGNDSEFWKLMVKSMRTSGFTKVGTRGWEKVGGELDEHVTTSVELIFFPSPRISP